MAVQQAFKSHGLTLLTLNGTTSVSTGVISVNGASIVVYNQSGANVSIDFEPAAFTATLSNCNYIVPPNSRMIITVPGNLPLYASAVADAATTAKVVIMRGEGSTY